MTDTHVLFLSFFSFFFLFLFNFLVPLLHTASLIPILLATSFSKLALLLKIILCLVIVVVVVVVVNVSLPNPKSLHVPPSPHGLNFSLSFRRPFGTSFLPLLIITTTSKSLKKSLSSLGRVKKGFFFLKIKLVTHEPHFASHKYKSPCSNPRIRF